MTVFYSGGCKNGKSSLAERTAVKLANGGPVYYIATMIPHDDEDLARIRRHVEERAGLGFITIECGRDLLSILKKTPPEATFLLDSVTALLSNEMFADNGDCDFNAGERVAGDLRSFVNSVNNAVFVSDFLYIDSCLYDVFTDGYRKALAQCDRALAAACDTVVEVSFAGITIHKGELMN